MGLEDLPGEKDSPVGEGISSLNLCSDCDENLLESNLQPPRSWGTDAAQRRRAVEDRGAAHLHLTMATTKKGGPCGVWTAGGEGQGVSLASMASPTNIDPEIRQECVP